MIKLNMFEKILLNRLMNNGFNFIARDEDDAIYAYTKEPYKDFAETNDQWICPGDSNWFNMNGDILMNDGDFEFVKWMDEKATSVNNLLSEAETVDARAEKIIELEKIIYNEIEAKKEKNHDVAIATFEEVRKLYEELFKEKD